MAVFGRGKGTMLHRPGWLDERSATTLLWTARDGLPWEQRSVRVFGRTVPQPRLVALLGAAYGYSGLQLGSAPMPGWAAELLARVSEVAGCRFNSILLNRYRDGRDSIAWHRDDERELGQRPIVASLSLGAARRFLVRERATKEVSEVLLGHGDLLVMPAGMQDTHEHSIPKTAVAGERISLTFRRLVG